MLCLRTQMRVADGLTKSMHTDEAKTMDAEEKPIHDEDKPTAVEANYRQQAGYGNNAEAV